MEPEDLYDSQIYRIGVVRNAESQSQGFHANPSDELHRVRQAQAEGRPLGSTPNM
jgi:hypothetical protein